MSLVRRTISFLILGIALSLSSPASTAETDQFNQGANQFVKALAKDAVTNLTGKELTDGERQENLRQILKSYFDVNGIGKWVLGRHWRKANAAERTEYLSLFEDLIVKTYATRFKAYSNEELTLAGTKSRGQTAIVRSVIKRNGQQPLRVDWRVTFPDGQYKIFDIVVEGVSMIQTQRSEFSSVIRRSGGKVSGLIAALREKSIPVNPN